MTRNPARTSPQDLAEKPVARRRLIGVGAAGIAAAVTATQVLDPATAEAKAATDVMYVISRESVEGQTVAEGVLRIVTTSYYTDHSGGGSTYIRQSAEPETTVGAFQTADGAWWVLDEARPSLYHFGARGDGEADDTQPFLDLVAYCQLGQVPAAYLGAGTFQCRQILLDSVRGVNFIGEGTIDPIKSLGRTILRYAPIDPADEEAKLGLLRLRSCAYLGFERIMFDTGANTELDYLICTSANGKSVVAPREKWATQFVHWTDCAFRANANAPCKRATLNLVSATSHTFNRCHFDGNPVAIKLGQDYELDWEVEDPDPDNRDHHTVTDGMATHPAFYDCYFRGDIERQRSIHMIVANARLYTRLDKGENQPDSTVCAFTVSGREEARHEVIYGCTNDGTGIRDFGRTWYTGGSNEVCDGLTMFDNQIAAVATVARIKRGSAKIFNNRLVAYGEVGPWTAFVLEPEAGVVTGLWHNSFEQWTDKNLEYPGQARLVEDKRDPTHGNRILSASLGEDLPLTPGGAVAVLGRAESRLPGCNVRMSYSVHIANATGTDVTYAAHLTIGGAVVAGTQSRVTADGAGEFVSLSKELVAYVEPSNGDVPVNLEVTQLTDGAAGTVKGDDSARTNVVIELVD